ncbi:UdgX family uracil-DNA binding protein [uncultured Tateyamaria sp.]|uniref:UdgX family uracil-DNA binding protein n=1 Tax=uncultured Tateyamaria sp. TaxID=455651 RepID=UPI002609C843|nr:UdgX family uracil-DNA binding protein [uncultured Tateyamaria sp.]
MPRIGTAQAWRDAARGLLAQGVPPQDVDWTVEGAPQGLFGGAPVATQAVPVNVPRSFLALAQSVVWHSDPQRFAHLYAVLWRLRDAPRLMQDRADPEVARLRRMEKAVHRCQHKMKAFVRFREVPALNPARRNFMAWFEPTHHTIEPTAEFFRKRYADMDWSIVSPDITARCMDGQVTFLRDVPRPDLPEDAHEDLWMTYYSNIFNPARLKVNAMTSEMPRKYWKNLPEAAVIPDLIAQAEARANAMAQATPTLPPVRVEAAQRQQQAFASRWASTGAMLEQDLRGCARCAIGCAATQVVPGEGPVDSPVMIVGEQPGDQEDLEGRPFVGPAGQVFDRAATEAGLDRAACYITNAVKHFKYRTERKRRIHERPDRSEIEACRWWLNAEIERSRPALIVAMGAVAAQALTGSGKDLLRRCGTIEETRGTPVLITVHPSFVLRCGDVAAQQDARRMLTRDLRRAARYL